MPWCPRCDETFPQGPACPRCSARLVAREREPYEETLQTVPALKQLKVSRRYLRAFDRLSGPRAPSSRAMALALVLLVFASGFLLGRVGNLGPIGPVVTAMPPAKAIPVDDVKGSISYLTTSREPLVTIAMHELFTGEVTPRARFSPPFASGEHVTTRVVSFGRSVAVIASSGGTGYVAVAPHDHVPHGWVLGIEAAWASERELLIRHVDGTVARWVFGSDSVNTANVEDADALMQTPAGPVTRRGSVLETASPPSRRLRLPEGAGAVAAVSPDMTRVLLDERVATLWDGKERTPIRNGQGQVLGATFDRSSERVAIVLRGPDGLELAVMDQKGDAQLKPLGNGDGCVGPPAWDAASRWIYVADGDGLLHVVEASGGRSETRGTRGVGCGVAWVDIG